MRVKKITKLNSGKYKVLFDNNEKIITYDDVILKNHLLAKKDLDYSQYSEIEKDTNVCNQYYKIISYINKKMRSEKEIRLYAEKIGVTKLKTDEFIFKLKESHLIDDRRLALAFTSDRFHLSSDGPYEIRKKLEAIDIKDEYIVNALSTLNEELIIQKLDKLMNKKISSNIKYSNYILQQKLYQYFFNLGYDRSMINERFNINKKETTDQIDKNYEQLKRKLSKKYEGNDLYYHIKSSLFQKGFSGSEIDKVLEKE